MLVPKLVRFSGQGWERTCIGNSVSKNCYHILPESYTSHSFQYFGKSDQSAFEICNLKLNGCSCRESMRPEALVWTMNENESELNRYYDKTNLSDIQYYQLEALLHSHHFKSFRIIVQTISKCTNTSHPLFKFFSAHLYNSSKLHWSHPTVHKNLLLYLLVSSSTL